jgi:hypothetical protein
MSYGNLERLRGLVDAHPPKIAQLDGSALTLVERHQPLQRLIQRQQVHVWFRRKENDLVQREFSAAAPSSSVAKIWPTFPRKFAGMIEGK